MGKKLAREISFPRLSLSYDANTPAVSARGGELQENL